MYVSPCTTSCDSLWVSAVLDLLIRGAVFVIFSGLRGWIGSFLELLLADTAQRKDFDCDDLGRLEARWPKPGETALVTVGIRRAEKDIVTAGETAKL